MTVIELNDDKLTYKRDDTKKPTKSGIFTIILILIIIFLCSFLFSLLQYFEWEPLQVLNKFKRIKKNMNSWMNIINEKSGIEMSKGKLLYLSKKNIGTLQCLDFGTYYTAGRLSNVTYLPEFIRKGNGGPWIINKASTIEDEAARQFCDYILTKYSTKVITCGINMYEELGYSGYFVNNSPCEKAMSVFSSLT